MKKNKEKTCFGSISKQISFIKIKKMKFLRRSLKILYEDKISVINHLKTWYYKLVSFILSRNCFVFFFVNTTLSFSYDIYMSCHVIFYIYNIWLYDAPIEFFFLFIIFETMKYVVIVQLYHAILGQR